MSDEYLRGFEEAGHRFSIVQAGKILDERPTSQVAKLDREEDLAWLQRGSVYHVFSPSFPGRKALDRA